MLISYIQSIMMIILEVICCKIFFESFAEKRSKNNYRNYSIILGIVVCEYVIASLFYDKFILKQILAIVAVAVFMCFYFKIHFGKAIILSLLFQALLLSVDYFTLWLNVSLFDSIAEISRLHFVGGSLITVLGKIILFLVVLLIRKKVGGESSDVLRSTDWLRFIFFPVFTKDSCNCLPVKVDDVYAAVLAVIKEQIQVFVDREMILKEHHNDSRVIRQEQVYTEAVNKCVKEMDRLMELKSGLYADYTEELLDEKEYLQLNREYSQRIEKLKIQADEYRQAASQYESAEKTVAQLKAEMLRFKGKRKLTQEMVDLFVAQVRIYENKNLEIVLNYEDELKKFAELNMEREAG